MATKRVLQGLLTDVQIKAWIRAGAPLAKSDGGGLTFTLSKAGTATWVLRYRMPGRRCEVTIGNYPDITLAEARKEAGQLRAMIDAGKDPAAEKRKAKQKAKAAKPIKWLIEDYEKKVLRHLSRSTNRTYKRQLERIDKEWGSRSAEEINHADVIELISKTKGTFKTHESGWRETETLYIVIREVFKHAAGQHIIQVNPGLGISLEAVIGKRPKAKVRLMLTDDELAELMHAKMNRQNQLSVAKYYVCDDIIQPERTYKTGNLQEGQMYRVIGTVAGKRNELEVEHVATKVRTTFNPARATKISVYQPLRAELSAGDWVRVTRHNASLDLANGARLEVVAVTPTTVTVAGSGRRLVLDAATAPLHLDRAYATTSHSAQGLTCDRALINAESFSRTTQRDVYYVAISRARHQTEIFTDNFAKLRGVVNRLEEKTAALDIGLEATRPWRRQEKAASMEIGS